MPSTKQPRWKFVTNLGDVNVADYGGFIVYRDATGVYPPEVEMYEPNEKDYTGGTMYRFILDPPRFKTCGHRPNTCRGYPNCDKLIWHNEWYVKHLDSIAESCGTTKFQLLRGLLSKDPTKRALAYSEIVAHFGAHEFDHYPLTLTEKEAQKRYKAKPTKRTPVTANYSFFFSPEGRKVTTIEALTLRDARRAASIFKGSPNVQTR